VHSKRMCNTVQRIKYINITVLDFEFKSQFAADLTLPSTHDA